MTIARYEITKGLQETDFVSNFVKFLKLNLKKFAIKSAYSSKNLGRYL